MTDNITTFSQDMDGSMEPDESGQRVRYEDVEDILSESKEQARLLGISAERELSLLAKIEKLLKELEEKTKSLKDISNHKMCDSDDSYGAFWDVKGMAKEVLDKYNNI